MAEQRPGSALKDVLPPIPSGRMTPSTGVADKSAVQVKQTDDLGDLPQLWNTVYTAANDLQVNAKKYVSILNKLLRYTYSPSIDARVRAGQLLTSGGLCKLIPVYWNLLGIASPDDWKKFPDTDPQVQILSKLLMALLNTTDTGDSSVITAVNAMLMEFMMSLLRSDVLAVPVSSNLQSRIVGLIVGIVYNCVHKMEDTRTLLRSKDGVSTFCTYSKSVDISVKTDAIIVLSYITKDNEQQELLTATHDNITYILHVLDDCLRCVKNSYNSKTYGYSATEILDGVNRMALADANKEEIVSCGALPLYEAFLKTDGFEDQMRLACQGLWTLAFNDNNRKKILENKGCMEGLLKLASSSSEMLKKAAKSALWVIEGQEKRVQSISAAAPTLRAGAKGGQIMLSYNWGVKHAVIKIKDRLKAAGYAVWIDVEQMSGSTLESMSQAIEEAELVLIFFTEKYKLSDSCRLEAGYTFKLGKKFIPIKMEANYNPDGWLGILIGAQLYFDFTKEGQWESIFQALCSEIDRLMSQAKLENSKGTPAIQETFAITQQLPPVPTATSSRYPTSSLQCSTWTTGDVQKWLTDAGLADHSEQFAKFRGRHIAELCHLLHHTPEIFYGKMAEEPYGLQFFELLSLAAALRELT